MPQKSKVELIELIGSKQLVRNAHELLCLIFTVVIESNGYFGHKITIVYEQSIVYAPERRHSHYLLHIQKLHYLPLVPQVNGYL